MAGNIQPVFAASADFAITLASLASGGAPPVAGQQSTAINTTGLIGAKPAKDLIVGGFITTGAVVAVGVIEVWAYGSVKDTPTYADQITGTNGAVTMSSREHMFDGLVLLVTINTSTTQNQRYPMGPMSLRQKFGGVMPNLVGLFIAQNTGVILNATGGNHAFSYTPVADQYT